ncbi:hypothetical protein MTR_5g027770 [Medicago truncatula]|uniref:Uncharacterized protein n=1 Tax=Medicago truncatula TaxID=3880 RepID=G7K9I2_MEDTR|nr:hypothetical protein MTR_5g027770 [Medicago truncatula]
MVIADTEISEDKREIDAPKSILKRHRAPSIGKMKKRVHWADQKSVDVPVLVVGTKSWPALSDAQTPKPNNHVQNVAVPAYAFPPGSGPYPNGLNPKPVSLVAAAQVQDPSEHSMEQHQQEKSNTDITELDRAFMKLFLNTDENNLIQAESVPGESHAPKRINRKRVHWAEDGKSVDVPVLVVGTKSWPALSDVQTPKAKNLVDNVSAKGENVAVSVPSVGHIAPRAPSVQKANSSGNFSPMNKMPSPSYQKPGPKRNVRPVAPPPHIAVPAYAFPPGSGPYPNAENPKPVSPVAAGQGFTPPARAIDAKHFPSFPGKISN